MQVGMLKLAGLKDEGCAIKLTDALKSVNGVNDADVSFDKAKASVTYDEETVSLQRLKVAVEEAGYAIAAPVHGEDGACCGGCGG
ncbi:MAG: heavy-metal-associated domain-containing protein [Alcaligenaceae bacterium]|nr:heavy-metal-associated domain-containing protein [Alcaligenaceae bacterium]